MNKGYMLAIVSISSILIVCIFTIVKYDNQLSDKSFYAMAGTQENYAWAIAKYAIQLNEFNALVNQNSNVKDVKSKLDLLFSRVNVIRNKSESTLPLYNQKNYKETIDDLYDKLSRIDNKLNKIPPDMQTVQEQIELMKPMTRTLVNLADNAEVTQRANALEEFKKERRGLTLFLYLSFFSSLLLGVIISIYIFKLNKLLMAEKLSFSNKNAFLGIVGHELRTSLQGIISVVDIITTSSDTSIQKKQLIRLEAAVEKMERQMKDLSEYARVDNGIVEIRKSYFNLRDLIQSSIDGCVDLYGKRHLEIHYDDIQNVVVYTDAQRLNQIVENLTSNAIKYTHSGTITASAIMDKNSDIVLKIVDTGQGIPGDKLKLIFKPFIRFSVDRHSIPGFGMGMPIVYGIVKAMKGAINISSKINEGTVITVRLPVSLGSESFVKSSSPKISTLPTSNYDIKILVIDDNEMACVSISELLAGLGFQVEHTTSAERALQKLFRKPFDLIISDLQMPMLTGDELFNATRSRTNPNSNTPFIFVSAYTDISPIHGSLLLSKPARVDEINLAISTVLSGKPPFI